MEKLDKIEITEEVTKTTKRKMKNCIVLGFAVLLAEVGFWFLYYLSHTIEGDGFFIFFFGLIMFGIRMQQFSFIEGFSVE